MSLIENLNTVPFDLELIVDFDPHGPLSHEDVSEFVEFAGRVERRISELYPTMEFHSSRRISGPYGGKMRGPSVHGTVDVKTFKEAFGDNVERGVSLLFIQFPILPCDAYVKWYQTGDLIVPDTLKDVVQGVYLGRSAIGSFYEKELIVPRNALKY